jgi:CRP-like cAMP-binding protein
MAHEEFLAKVPLFAGCSPAQVAAIAAVAQTSCLMLSTWDFRALLEHQPSIAIKLLEVLSRRLRVADERISQ